jgi:putative RNA 2'-phosphotransferase
MDEEGFVYVDDLLDLIDERQRSLDWVEAEHIEELSRRGDGRRRFEVKGDQVRATYGHSFHRPIRYPAVEPPELLYIGVAKTKTGDLRRDGLRPDRRQYVHLSESREEAEEVGRHHADTVSVITVHARDAHEGGIQFHHPTEGIFLTPRVPAQFLDLQVSFGRAPKKGRRRR